MFFNECKFNSFMSGMMKADITEDQDNYNIVMDAYKVNKDNIEIKYEEGYLTVSYVFGKDEEEPVTVEDSEKPEEKDALKILLNERVNYDTKRTFFLPHGDLSKSTAKLVDGELNIVLPKEKTRVTDIVIE